MRYKKKKKSYTDMIYPVFIFLIALSIIYKDTIIENKTIFGLGVALFILILLGWFYFKLYKKNKEKQKYLNSGIIEIDKMSGIEFENLLKHYFEKLGYRSKLTKQTNDYGADLILTKDNESIIVQAKRYSDNKVGIKAVQEVLGAMNVYKGKGMVVTNSFFSNQATELAKNCYVELWDRTKLIEVMNNIQATSFVSDFKNETCPLCGNKTIIKSGKKGSFIGCSSFPKCRFSKSI